MDDGVRSLEDPWEYLGELFNTLKELDIPYFELGEPVKNLQERVRLVRRYSSQVSAERGDPVDGNGAVDCD